jgi:hyaluronoglucosaminidase
MPVYWNFPTHMCQQHGINFTELTTKFSIVQNEGDQFRGDIITKLDEPGRFPKLFSNINGVLDSQNGGVPQFGKLSEHIEIFKKNVEELVPDVHNNGL